jgi:hypothetical protein
MSHIYLGFPPEHKPESKKRTFSNYTRAEKILVICAGVVLLSLVISGIIYVNTF